MLYRQICSTSADGKPWSVHVLEIDNKRSRLTIRALSGRGPDHNSEMQREEPTSMAKRAAEQGANVLAVVNGDFDAAPLNGVSVGPSVTSGRLWTAGGSKTWPAFAIRSNGKPVIGSPRFSVEVRGGGRKLSVSAFNKPFARFTEPVLYSRDFRQSIKSEKPFRAIIIGELRAHLPARVGSMVKGQVARIVESTTEVAIPEEALVLIEPPRVPASKELLQEGQHVSLRFDLRIDGHRDVRDVVGGHPALVRNGRVQIEGDPGENLRKRHPRTAVCYNDSKVIFTVVDGRQPSLSIGMTLNELATLMLSLGCKEAMNTDGGGSSVMAVRPPDTTSEPTALQIVNSPSDGKERGRGNAFIIEGPKTRSAVAPAAAKN